MAWLSVVLACTVASHAQDVASRLRHSMPAQWTVDTDGETWLPTSNRDNAAVVFSPSKPFTGTAEQWATEKRARPTCDFKRGNQLGVRSGAAPHCAYFTTILGPDALDILGSTYRRTLRAAP